MGRANRFSPEVQERAVRLVIEQTKDYHSQWEAIRSIAVKIGCTPETLRVWVSRTKSETESGQALTNDERELLKQLQRENRELKRTNEILKAASAFFAKAEFERLQK